MCCRSFTSFTFLFCLLPLRLGAQIWTVPEKVLDSLANPVEAESGKFMAFETKAMAVRGIREDELPVYEYKFVNNWDKPLAISGITSSCSCAVAKASADVIAPGESGSINVTYHPEGHPGKFRRRIFVYTNMSATKPTAVLSLDVSVEATSPKSSRFPHQMGRMRMKVKEYSFHSDLSDMVCLSFLNIGDTPLTPQVDCNLLPAYLKVWCETPDVEQDKEGEICVAFDSEKFAETPHGRQMPVRIPVVFKGLGVSPSASAITINIEL